MNEQRIEYEETEYWYENSAWWFTNSRGRTEDVSQDSCFNVPRSVLLGVLYQLAALRTENNEALTAIIKALDFESDTSVPHMGRMRKATSELET